MIDLKKGIENKESIPVIVLLGEKVVGAYGSMGECEKNIKNISKRYLSKILKLNGNYAPKEKIYKYKPISVEEYHLLDNRLKGVKLIENHKPKMISVFKATNLKSQEEIISDNQKQFCYEYDLESYKLSKAIKKGEIYGGFKFEFIKKIPYVESSAYKKLIESKEDIVIKNIVTNEIRKYKTTKELKDDLGYKGHSIQDYRKLGHILMEEWKII